MICQRSPSREAEGRDDDKRHKGIHMKNAVVLMALLACISGCGGSDHQVSDETPQDLAKKKLGDTLERTNRRS